MRAVNEFENLHQLMQNPTLEEIRERARKEDDLVRRMKLEGGGKQR